ERLLANSLPFTNPPYHTRIRGLVAGAFKPRRIKAIQAQVEHIADGLLDTLAHDGGGDLMSTVAYPLPATAIMEFIGLPAADPHRMTQLATEMMALLGAQYAKDAPSIARNAHAAMTEFFSYMTGLIAERRATPGEDLLSTLAAKGEGTDSDDDDASGLTDE